MTSKPNNPKVDNLVDWVRAWPGFATALARGLSDRELEALVAAALDITPDLDGLILVGGAA